ncbi:hypothetical protein HYFRA_00013795 [Hymenoscyphus fraxineus]|uniref:Alternative oxidase n=1 Tax=Hymenoscyphus fraxineus TaxID=746836 RepID=A0A9N9L8C1_9HELO|nr:hypothetical protein HYFRA_00013795 [Hymenoscyphus fraxineus]
MVQRDDMITGIWRIKWWKYRYVLVAGLLANILLINHFFFDQSITDLSPFPPPKPPTDHIPPPPNPVEAGHAPPPKSESPPPSAVGPVLPTSSSTFNIYDYNFNAEFVGWPLERLCKETVWVEGLVFVCDNNSGGIGNIRNFILTCIRYAIDSGATGMIMPQIQRRSEEDLANLFNTGFQPFTYFFDDQHFISSMTTFCPQIKIFPSKKEIPHTAAIDEIAEFYPKDLGDLDGCDGRGVNRHLDQFRGKFDQWRLDNNHNSSWDRPTTVRFRWATFFEWPIYRDGPEFAATFGDLLRINKDVEAIAIKVLKELSRFAGVEPSPTKLSAPYLGVHLRTESDALGFWPDYEVQSEGYLKEAEHRNLKHAYLACGNASEGHRFAEKAMDRLQLRVTSKLDLLKGQDLAKLQALSWDQQALVDYLVLTKSTHFTGCSFSSFTMNISFKRHLMTGGIHSRPWKSPGDAFSTLVGRFESWYGDWMFMYECMWP